MQLFDQNSPTQQSYKDDSHVGLSAIQREDVPQAIRQVASRLREWWGLEGFGHINKLTFLENGAICATLACSFVSVSHHLIKAHSDKAYRDMVATWQTSMKQKGFVIEGTELVDCEPSRQALRRLVESLPASELASTLSYRLNIREAVVLFQDADALLSLPRGSSDDA